MDMSFANRIYNAAYDAAANNIIWVAEWGCDSLPNKRMGDFDCPYATIDAAVAAMTATKNIVCIMPGDYTLTSALSVSVDDGAIIGLGGANKVSITGFATADYCFKVAMAATSGTKEFTFKNLYINHTDDATQVGIQIDNAAMTAKLIVYLEDVEFNSANGNSLDIDHTVTTHGIRVYAKRSLFEGPVNAVCIDNGDRFRFTDCTLRGGVVTDAGDVDAELMMLNCLVLHEGVTGGHANQRGFALNCVTETDASTNVYAGFDTNDFAGSHTEVIWPAS